MAALGQRRGMAGLQREMPCLPSSSRCISGRGIAPVGTRPQAASAALPRSSRRAATVKAVIEAPSIKYEPTTRSVTSSVLAIILGGGAGSRLYPLTRMRAKPAVPIGGTYRLIDVPMSNCINSGLNKIYIMTQFNSTSLNRHLARAYNGVRFGGDGFVEVLAATQTPTDTEWFQGTADAVRQYAWLLEDIKNRTIEEVVILSGDHLYRMDYMKFVNYHREADADVTIGCIAYGEDRARDFGLMRIDDNRRVVAFAEKPTKREELDAMKVDTTIFGLTPEEAAEKSYIASMGIYVFKKEVLIDLLTKRFPKANDFGGEIIPGAAKDLNVVAYPFYGYWEDIGTIKSFFEENLKLCRHPAAFEFYDPTSPMYTSPRVLPPATVEKSRVSDAIISHGCNVRESSIQNAVLGLRSIIGKGCTIQDAMIMGSDYYESDEQVEQLLAAGGVPLGVGAGSYITNAIIDKNARVGKNVQIVNKEGIEESRREELGYYIRSGITVVVKGAVIPDNMII